MHKIPSHMSFQIMTEHYLNTINIAETKIIIYISLISEYDVVQNNIDQYFRIIPTK